MAAAYVLYRYCPVVWPFVVGHGVFDVLQALSDGSGARAATFDVLEVLVAIAGAALAAAVILAARRTHGLEPPAALHPT